MEPRLSGGCLCGRVRYQTYGSPHTPHWCHCSMCRRATGSPAAAWVNFRLPEFRFTSEEPQYYESSPGIRRGFCRECGGSICTLEENDDFISILIGSLDDPGEVRPAYHIWTRSGICWLQVDPDIPVKS